MSMLEDHLEDDPVINSQNFFILSYVIPKKGDKMTTPILKMRGAYKTQEECTKRVEVLKKQDKIFNMYVCEVGKWGALYSAEELSKNSEIEVIYREKDLNDMVKGCKDEKAKVEENFDQRKERMKLDAIEEGKKEFQEYLVFLKDATHGFFSLQDKSRDEFVEYSEDIKDVKAYLEFLGNLKSCNVEAYKKFKLISENDVNEDGKKEDLVFLKDSIRTSLELHFK